MKGVKQMPIATVFLGIFSTKYLGLAIVLVCVLALWPFFVGTTMAKFFNREKKEENDNK